MNDGIMNNPTLLKSSNPPMGKRIVLPKASNLTKELTRSNVTEVTNKFVEVRRYLEQLKNKKRTLFEALELLGIYILISNDYPKICRILYVVLGEPKACAKTIGYATAGGMLLRQSIDDYKYSALCCLLFIHGLYSNPDETKMDQIRMKLDIDACNRNDYLNAMRL